MWVVGSGDEGGAGCVRVRARRGGVLPDACAMKNGGAQPHNLPAPAPPQAQRTGLPSNPLPSASRSLRAPPSAESRALRRSLAMEATSSAPIARKVCGGEGRRRCVPPATSWCAAPTFHLDVCVAHAQHQEIAFPGERLDGGHCHRGQGRRLKSHGGGGGAGGHAGGAAGAGAGSTPGTGLLRETMRLQEACARGGVGGGGGEGGCGFDQAPCTQIAWKPSAKTPPAQCMAGCSPAGRADALVKSVTALLNGANLERRHGLRIEA